MPILTNEVATRTIDLVQEIDERVVKTGDTMSGQLNISSGGLSVTGNLDVLTLLKFSDGTTQNTAPVATPSLNINGSNNIIAVTEQHYVLTNTTNTTTVTMPSSPSSGDRVWITIQNGRTDTVVNRNSENINSLAEDMTIDLAYAAIQFRYANSALGWIFS